MAQKPPDTADYHGDPCYIFLTLYFDLEVDGFQRWPQRSYKLDPSLQLNLQIFHGSILVRNLEVEFKDAKRLQIRALFRQYVEESCLFQTNGPDHVPRPFRSSGASSAQSRSNYAPSM